MSHTIAILSDVHGNKTALDAVIKDMGTVDEVWFLGDLFYPGPASTSIIETIKKLNPSVWVKGNWEDVFLGIKSGDIDYDNPSDVYASRLTMHLLKNLSITDIEFIENLPNQVIKERGGLTFSITHNYPDKNWGPDLVVQAPQENFNKLFYDNSIDVAVYGHVHHPTLRYGVKEQMIINPGSIGQPFNNHGTFKKDMRAEYTLLKLSEEGIEDIQFKKVGYDIEKELTYAKEKELPYLKFYRNLLHEGNGVTHNKEVLQKENDLHNYRQIVLDFFTQKK